MPGMLVYVRRRRTGVLIFLSIFVSLADGQLSKQSTADPNAWMKTPSLPSADTVSASTRDQRNLYWDNHSPVRKSEPLTAESARHYARSEDGGATGPEIREVPNRAVLIGTFVSHQSVLTTSSSARLNWPFHTAAEII